MLNPFTPAGTVSRAGATTTANVALAKTGHNQAQITVVAGGNLTFFVFGNSTVEATVAGFPVQPGTSKIISIDPAATHVAAITAASTSTSYITVGDGQ